MRALRWDTALSWLLALCALGLLWWTALRLHQPPAGQPIEREDLQRAMQRGGTRWGPWLERQRGG